MKLTVFLDSNIFIFAFERESSNSSKIIQLLTENVFTCIVSEKVVEEIAAYFKKYYSSELSWKFKKFVFDTCRVVPRSQVVGSVEKLKGVVHKGDIEHVATARALGLRYIVSYDSDYEAIAEYITPKKFVQMLGFKEAKAEY